MAINYALTVCLALEAVFSDPANWGKDGSVKFRPDNTVYAVRNALSQGLPKKERARVLEVTGSAVLEFGHSNLISFNNSQSTSHTQMLQYLRHCVFLAGQQDGEA